MSFNEHDYENAIIALLVGLGYDYQYGPEITRDYHLPYNEDQLWVSLAAVNPDKCHGAISEAVKKITSIDSGDLCQKNELFMSYLQNGVEVSYHDGKEIRHEIVYLIDYKNVLSPQDSFLHRENYPRVCDIVDENFAVLYENGETEIFK